MSSESVAGTFRRPIGFGLLASGVSRRPFQFGRGRMFASGVRLLARQALGDDSRVTIGLRLGVDHLSASGT